MFSRHGVQRSELGSAVGSRGGAGTGPFSAAGRRVASSATGVSMQLNLPFQLPGSAPADAKGKGVVITGAAGGVGYAYADEFLAKGLKVLMFPTCRRLLASGAGPNSLSVTGPTFGLHVVIEFRLWM